MKRLLVPLSLAAAAVLSSCAVSPLPPEQKQAAIKEVEGEWVLASDNMLLGLAYREMNANRMSIRPDGTMYLSLNDSALQNRVTVTAMNDAGFEMRLSQSVGGSRMLIYDRPTNTLTVPIRVGSQDQLTGAWKRSYVGYSFRRAGMR